MRTASDFLMCLPDRTCRRARRTVALVVLLVLGAARFVVAQGVFTETGRMQFGRTNFSLTLLADGRVLALGDGGSVNPFSAEVYDPATGAWSPAAPPNRGRGFHTATLLKNGKVLVAGGQLPDGASSSSVELYDPSDGSWTPTGDTVNARSHHVALLLTNGKVLVAGGLYPGFKSAELYDPDTGQWSLTGSPTVGRYNFSGVLLHDGRVLVVGSGDQFSAEIYDPILGTWSTTGPVLHNKAEGFSLTVLPDGKVLIAGGWMSEDDAEIFDPATGLWTLAPSLPGTRLSHAATLLLDGTVLLAGGRWDLTQQCCALDTGLLYDPTSQTWTSIFDGPRMVGLESVRLLDGRVLLAGGYDYVSQHSPSGALLVTRTYLFTGVTGTVIPLFSVEVTAPTTLSLVNGTYQPNPFTVTARVRNVGAATAMGVTVSASLPPGLTLATGSFTEGVADIPPGEFRDVTWTVNAAGQKQSITSSYFVTAVSSDGTGKSVSKQIALPGGAFTVGSITPRAGGDNGSVTMHINGGGILDGATVTLVRNGEPDVAATAVSVAGDGLSVSATFDLTGKTLGLWSVFVTNLGGITLGLTDVFTVKAGRAPDVLVHLIGPSTSLAGRPTTVYLVYSNRGNVDATGVVLWISIPKTFSWQLLGHIESVTPPQLDGLGQIDWSQYPYWIERDGDTLVPVIVPSIEPQSTGVLSLQISGAVSGKLTAGTSSPINDAASTCSYSPLGCSEAGVAHLKSEIETLWSEHLSRPDDASIGQQMARKQQQLVWCLWFIVVNDVVKELALKPIATNVAHTFIKVNGIWQWILDQVVDKAVDKVPVLSPPLGCSAEILPITVVPPPPPGDHRSFDPNDKAGAQGVGPARFVTGDTPVPYEVLFENLDVATAPAHEIVVTDQLNAGALDLSTFNLGPISFGETLVVPPPGLSQYTSDVDLRPANNLIVRINAGLDAATGLAAWHFVSLDPTTMLPPDDWQSGFLPPNVTSPEGQGSVLFTVNPKPNLPTGIEIRNKATIVFDTNAPINTPEWFNTIDSDKPLSHVGSLPSTTTSTDFPVQWSGADFGAGVQDYSVFVSADGGPFAPFVSNTADTSATFTGQIGHTYAFYSFARDQVGNVEDAKSAAEASTRVVLLDTTPPVMGPVHDIVAEATSLDGASVNYDPPTTLDAVDGPGVAVCTPAPGSQFALGATTVSCYGYDVAGNNSYATFIVTVRDTTPPSLALPQDIAVGADGREGAAVHYPDVIATDLVDGVDPVQCTPASGFIFPIGTTTVSCSSHDNRGNAVTGTFHITVLNHPPVAVPDSSTTSVGVPVAIPVLDNDSEPDGGPLTVSAVGSPAHGTTVSDAAGVVTYTPAARFVGTDTFNYTASDPQGATSTAAVTVTVRDTTAPVIGPVADLNVGATSDKGALVTYASPPTTDDVDPDGVATCTPASGGVFPLGPTTVTCTAKDAAGNSSSRTFKITVRDTTPPVMGPVKDAVAEATNLDGATVNYEPPTTLDAVDGPGVATCTPAPGSQFAFGATTVNCYGYDAAGNNSFATLIVTVRDTTPPSLALPHDIEVGADGREGAAVSYPVVIATDLVDGVDPVQCDHASGAIFPIGTTTVSCSSHDNRGNTATGTFHITVLNHPPVAAPDIATTLVAVPVAIPVLDNDTEPDGGPLTVSAVGSPAHGVAIANAGGVVTYTPAARFAGTDTFTYTASDPQGATSTAAVTVTVRDITAPVIGPVVDLLAEATSNAGAAVNYTSPPTTDNLDPDGVATCTPASGGTFPPGPTTVTCTAKDVAGNSSSRTFKITVRDTTPPTVAAPPDVVVGTGPGSTQARAFVADATLGSAVASDSAGAVTVARSGVPAGNIFPIGTTTIAYTATDASGNAATATQRVTINDTTPPVVSGSNATVPATSTAGAVVNLTVSATDNVTASPAVTCNPASGSTFPIGTTPVTCTATDGAGNTGSTTLSVTVLDNAPVAVNDVATTANHTGVSGNVLTNDTDIDTLHSLLTASLVTGPAHGTAGVNPNGTFTYAPTGTFAGTDTFTYTASDGTLISNLATVTITVQAATTGGAPTARDDRYRTRKNTVLTVGAPGVLANDSDPAGHRLSAVLVSTVSHGRLTLNANGSFTYTPARNFTGTDRFTYKARNADGLTDDATVSIAVSGHFDGDRCDHELHRNGHHEGDECEHDRDRREDEDDRDRQSRRHEDER